MHIKNLCLLIFGLTLIEAVFAKSNSQNDDKDEFVDEERYGMRQLTQVGDGLGDAQISVTFHLTDAFRKLFINGAELSSYIQDIIADANQGFINSRIPMKIVLQSIVSSSLLETKYPTTSGMVSAFGTSFGSLSLLRQNADIGILLVSSANYGDSCIFNGVYNGRTYGIINFASKSAYNPTKFGDCLASLFGCYKLGLGPPTRALTSSYGYIWLNPMAQTNGFRTINTFPVTQSFFGYTPAQFNIQLINYYSNPNVTFNGIPTGSAFSNDAQTFTQNRFQLASIGNESLISSPSSDLSQVLVVSGTKTQIISLKTNSVVCTGSLPVTNYGSLAGLDYEDDPLFCGDTRSSNATKICYKLTKSKTWIQAPPPPFFSFIAGTSNPKNYGNGRMVAFGAKTSDGAAPSDKIDYLTPRGWFESSSKLPFLPTSGCAISINSTTAFFIPAGKDSNNVMYGKTFFFDFVNDKLVDGPPRPRPSLAVKCARLFDPLTKTVKIIAAAGVKSNFADIQVTDVLDLTTGTWSTGPNLPYALTTAARMVEHPSGGVVFLGSSLPTRTIENTFFYLEAATSTWKTLPGPNFSFFAAFAATLVPDSVDCTVNTV